MSQGLGKEFLSLGFESGLPDMENVKKRPSFLFWLLSMSFVILALGGEMAWSRPDRYPAVRFRSISSQGLAGVSTPLSEGAGQALMNNPSDLSGDTRLTGEGLQLQIEGNSKYLSSLGTGSLSYLGYSGMAKQLQGSPGEVMSAGFSNLSAVSWKGLGAGVLYTERVRGVSDGTVFRSQAVQQFIPAVGYSLGLARRIFRLGYSLHFVNTTVGSKEVAHTETSAGSFFNGVQQGKGLSHNLGFSLAFPFTYLPKVNVVARNIGGLVYQSGTFLSRGSSPSGTPDSESMSIDASLSFMIRISSSLKSYWYLENQDMTNANGLSFLDRFYAGTEIDWGNAFLVRAGVNGFKYGFGASFRGSNTEFGFAFSQEPTTFSAPAATQENRYSIQYKFYLEGQNKRDRESEMKGKL